MAMDDDIIIFKGGEENDDRYVGDFCSWEDVCMSLSRLLIIRAQRTYLGVS